MPIRIAIAADVGRSLIDLLERDDRFDLRFAPVRDEDALVRLAAEAEILVTRHFNKVTARVLETASSLRLVAQGTSGTDNIDYAAASARGVEILALPGENANAVAELVISFMIGLTRTIPYYDLALRRGEWPRDDCATRHELRHYRLGVVGLGRVGSRVTRLAAAFGVRARAFDPYLDDATFERHGVQRFDTLRGLLGDCDILTLHVPLTGETRRMIGGDQLDQLPRGSFVINACRGEVIDHDALASRLADGRIAGAALDVFFPEPPEALERFPPERAILTPHIAGCSAESKGSIGRLLYERICRFLELEPMGNV